MKYKVTITETLKRTVEVEAASYMQAQNIAEDMYNNEDIVLDYNDFYEVNFWTEL